MRATARMLLALLAIAACGKSEVTKAPAHAEPSPPSAAPIASAKPAPSASAAPSAPPAIAADSAPGADAGPDASRADAKTIPLADPDLRAWVDARVAAAKRGARERVRIPLVRQGKGWGCVCPPHYVGTNPTLGQGPWLDVTFAKGVRPLRVGEAVMAEGSFGSPLKHVAYPGGPPPADKWEYDLVPFTVTSTAPLGRDDDETTVQLELR